MNESNWKTAAVRQMKKIGGYGRRIEDKYGVGFPDLIVKLPSHAVCFCEVKLVTGRYFAPSPRQLLELQALDQPGQFALLVGFDPVKLITYISPPVERVDTIGCYCSHDDFPHALELYLANRS